MTKQVPHAGLRAVVVIIGNCNAGKSTLLNAIIGQEVSITSEEKGTTTDAVLKTYELLPAGPISFYDTAGLDDNSKLGAQRIKNAEKILNRADMVLIVIGKDGLTRELENHMRKLKLNNIPFIPVFNYADVKKLDKYHQAILQLYNGIEVSAKTGEGIEALKNKMTQILIPLNQNTPMLQNLISAKDMVILVTPIDEAAPQGRLIMPEVQALREILDNHAKALVVQPEELSETLQLLNTPPKLIITDSQVIKEVAKIVPESIPLATFSMLLARSKGNFPLMLQGIQALKELSSGAKILIAEGCSHRQTCNDIGRVKIPALIKQKTNKDFQYTFTSGLNFPDNLKDYALVIHCGGCVLNKMELRRRLNECANRNIPITNYGMVISYAQGILERLAKTLS